MAPSEKIPKPPLPLNDQSDWAGWSTIVTNALRGSGLLDHLTSTGPVPPSISTVTSSSSTASGDDDLQTARAIYVKESSDWQLQEFRVMDYLTRCVGSGLTVEIGSLPSARAMWTRLTERFTECSGAREAYLLQCIALQRKGSSSLQSHFGQMQAFWTELRSMLPGRNSTYEDWLAWYERREVHQLFQSLPEYSTMADQLLHQPQFPPLASVMGALNAYETRQQTARLNLSTDTPISSLETALSVPITAPVMNHTSSHTPSPQARSKLSCKYCKKEGHRIETCFKLHPELRSSGTGRGRRPPQSQPSRTPGLLANAIPSTTSDSTIQAIESLRRQLDVFQHITSTSASQISGMHFAGSSANPSVSGMNDLWIFDSGCSFHMTCNASLLSSVFTSSSIPPIYTAAGQQFVYYSVWLYYSTN